MGHMFAMSYPIQIIYCLKGFWKGYNLAFLTKNSQNGHGGVNSGSQCYFLGYQSYIILGALVDPFLILRVPAIAENIIFITLF